MRGKEKKLKENMTGAQMTYTCWCCVSISRLFSCCMIHRTLMAPSDALKADTEQSDTDCGPRRRQTRLTECVFTQYEGDGGTHLWLLFLHSLKEQFTQNSKISRYPLPLRMLKFRSPQNRKTAMNSWSSWRQCPDLFYYFPSLVAVCFHVKMSAREDESFMCTCVL